MALDLMDLETTGTEMPASYNMNNYVVSEPDTLYVSIGILAACVSGYLLAKFIKSKQGSWEIRRALRKRE